MTITASGTQSWETSSGKLGYHDSHSEISAVRWEFIKPACIPLSYCSKQYAYNDYKRYIQQRKGNINVFL